MEGVSSDFLLGNRATASHKLMHSTSCLSLVMLLQFECQLPLHNWVHHICLVPAAQRVVSVSRFSNSNRASQSTAVQQRSRNPACCVAAVCALLWLLCSAHVQGMCALLPRLDVCNVQPDFGFCPAALLLMAPMQLIPSWHCRV